MPGREGIAAIVELQPDRIEALRLERRGLGVAVAVGEVEHAVGDPPRGAVRRDVAQARAELRMGA